MAEPTIKSNFGGLLGAIAGGVVGGVILTNFVDFRQLQDQFLVIAMAAVGVPLFVGFLAGNYLWARVFSSRKAKEQEKKPDDPFALDPNEEYFI